MDKVCKDCGKKICYNSKGRCKSCSKKGALNPMFGKTAEKAYQYKGGYVHKTLGYKFVMQEGKKVYEHRKIMEEHIGRKLRRDEVIHHINHNKTDNRIENLKILSQAEHVRLHKPRLGK